MNPYRTIKFKNAAGKEFELEVDYHPIYGIPHSKELIKEYWDKNHPLSDGELAFDFDYAIIKEHMEKNKVNVSSVTDIGCAWGIQNLFFQEIEYIGIDLSKASGQNIETREYIDIPFFREGEPGVNYYITKFPHGIESKMIGDVFISNMAVGYTSLSSEELERMYDAFSLFNGGYIRAGKEVMSIVKEVFPKYELVRPECYDDDLGLNKMYFLHK